MHFLKLPEKWRDQVLPVALELRAGSSHAACK